MLLARATDFVAHTATGRDIHGIENWKQNISAMFNAFPDVRLTIDDIVAERARPSDSLLPQTLPLT